ncbi:MAG: Na+/H+ antiporter subunit E [Nitriliruptoraceae bacterium]
MRTLRALVLFALLLGFWQLLSWRIDPLFLVMGVISAAVLTAFSLWLMEHVIGPREGEPRLSMARLLVYLAWLLPRIFASGFAVARVVLDPRLSPRPGVVRFTTNLQSPAARTMLANSITLTPGTITLNVDGDEFTVHAFTVGSVADLAQAAMQARIARVFGVPADAPPRMRWDPVNDPPAEAHR